MRIPTAGAAAAGHIADTEHAGTACGGDQARDHRGTAPQGRRGVRVR